jgi:Uncharacterized protein conserved in bacteria (DUF2197)
MFDRQTARCIKHTVYSCAPLDGKHCVICERADARDNLVPASGRLGNERAHFFLHADCFERELQKDA